VKRGKLKIFIWNLVFIAFLTACGSRNFSVHDFKSFEINTVNGTYYNGDKIFSRIFHLLQLDTFDRWDNPTDFINLEYNPNNSDTLKLSYYTEKGLQQSYFKGKLKDKFFQIYFDNTRIYIPFFTIVNVAKLRMGLDKNSNLAIHYQRESWGWILLFAAGAFDDDVYYLSKFDISKCSFLIPYMENEKWGFIDNTKTTVIEPIYDFVRLFEKGVARVKLNGKWGLINEKGEAVTEIKYDKIYAFNHINAKDSINDDLLMQVVLNNKIGYINTSGKEIIPPEYDEIYYPYRSLSYYKREFDGITTFPSYFDAYGKTRKGNKYGYVTNEGVFCPPVFDKVSYDFSRYVCFLNHRNTTLYGKVIYKGEKYLLDTDGFMYKYKCTPDKLTIFEETKIKVSELKED
jgi:hypothetical protein